MPITLSSLAGATTIDIGPAALREAEGGIALRSTTFGDRVIYTFTRDEALQLITAIREELVACADSTPIERLRAFYQLQ